MEGHFMGKQHIQITQHFNAPIERISPDIQKLRARKMFGIRQHESVS